jgi:hypothetical protein
VKEGIHLTPTARVDDFDTANVFVELGSVTRLFRPCRDIISSKRIASKPSPSTAGDFATAEEIEALNTKYQS